MRNKYPYLLKLATFRQLKVFEAVAKVGNFTIAAQALHLTQPTVSTQIKKLADDIGAPLFEQLGRKVYLTEIGKELLNTCEAIFDNIEAFNTKLTNIKGFKGGNLRLAGVTTTEYFAPLILGAFYQRHPGIKVTLTISDRETLLQRLENNKDDIYILDRVPEIKDLVITTFVENPLVVVAPPLHKKASRKHLSIHDLLDEHFVVREPDSGTRLVFERFLAKEKVSINWSMELSSNEAIKRSVIAGLGIAVLSQHAVHEECVSGSLVTLDVRGFPLCDHWYSVYPKNKTLSDVAAAFQEFLTQEGKQYIDASLKRPLQNRRIATAV